jgi:hypothetical protein
MDDAAGIPLNVARQVEFRLPEVEVPGRGGCCGRGNLKLSFGLTWPSVFHRRVVGCGWGESCFFSDCLLLFLEPLVGCKRSLAGRRRGQGRKQASSYGDFFLSLPNLRPKKDTILQRRGSGPDQLLERLPKQQDHLLVLQSLLSASPPWLQQDAMNR